MLSLSIRNLDRAVLQNLRGATWQHPTAGRLSTQALKEGLTIRLPEKKSGLDDSKIQAVVRELRLREQAKKKSTSEMTPKTLERLGIKSVKEFEKGLIEYIQRGVPEVLGISDENEIREAYKGSLMIKENTRRAHSFGNPFTAF